MPTVVSNASPLIILSMVNQLDRLNDLFDRVSISQEVHAEVVVRGRGKPGSSEVGSSIFLDVVPLSHPAKVEEIVSAHTLGAGEASTLALAGQLNAGLVLVDDRRARVVARSIGVRVAGTVRILELAHERGFLSDLGTVYRELLATPARILPSILDESLRRLGLPGLE